MKVGQGQGQPEAVLVADVANRLDGGRVEWEHMFVVANIQSSIGVG